MSIESQRPERLRGGKLHYYRCTCCGEALWSVQPQDPNLDTGFGRCELCKPRLVADMVKCGWGRSRPWTQEEAEAHVNKHA